MAKLIVNPGDKQQEFVVQGELTIGRKSTNNVVLPQSYVSRNHARISRQGPTEYLLEDLSGTTGVGLLVNGEKVERRVLQNQDKIEILDIQILFEDLAAQDEELTIVPQFRAKKAGAPSSPAVAADGAPAGAKAAPLPEQLAPIPVQAPPAEEKEFEAEPAEPVAPVAAPVAAPAARTLEQAPPAHEEAFEPVAGKSVAPAPSPAAPAAAPVMAPSPTPAAAAPAPAAPPAAPPPAPAPPASGGEPDFEPSLISAEGDMAKALADQLAARGGVPMAGQLTPIMAAEKKKNKMVLVLLVILVLGGGVAYWLFTSQPEQQAADILPPIEAKFTAGAYADVVKLATEAQKVQLPMDQADRLKTLKKQAESKLKAQEVHSLIFDKNEFLAAWQLAQDAMNTYVESSDEFVKLAGVAIAADFIIKAHKQNKDVAQVYDVDALKKALKDLQQVQEKWKQNQESLAKLPTVQEGYTALTPLLALVQKRLADFDVAGKSWEAAKSARLNGNWAAEVKAFQDMSTCANDVVSRVTEGLNGAVLLANASAFNAAVEAFQNEDYATAATQLAKVQKDDFHYQLAQKMAIENTRKAQFQKAVSYYQKGDVAQSLREMDKVPEGKDVEDFKVHARQVKRDYDKLTDMHSAQEWDTLIVKGDDFVKRLDKKIDVFFLDGANKLLTEARRTRKQLDLATLKKDFETQNYVGLLKRINAYIEDLDKTVYPEFFTEATDLKKRAVGTVSTAAARWTTESETLWKQYKQSPITPEERSGGMEVIPSYQKKVAVLKELYPKANNAYGLMESLPDDQRAIIKDVYIKVRDEIINQSEILYSSVRRAYANVDNTAMVRLTEEKILMFPEVAGNRWYEDVFSSRQPKKSK